MVLVLAGRLDGAAQHICDREFAGRVTEGAKRIVLDCADLEFVSSAGVRCIIKLIKLVRTESGAVVVCRPRDTVRQLLEFAGLGSMLPVTDSLVEAAARG